MLNGIILSKYCLTYILLVTLTEGCIKEDSDPDTDTDKKSSKVPSEDENEETKDNYYDDLAFLQKNFLCFIQGRMDIVSKKRVLKGHGTACFYSDSIRSIPSLRNVQKNTRLVLTALLRHDSFPQGRQY